MTSNRLPSVPKITSLNEALPVDQASAFSFVTTRTPVDMTKTIPTIMNNYNNQTMQTMLELSSKTLPPLDFVLMSFWCVTAHDTLPPGHYEGSETITKVTSLKTNTRLSASASGLFEDGSWATGASVHVDTTSTTTTVENSSVTRTVKQGTNLKHLFWQWTTCAGFAIQGANVEEAGSKPYWFEDPYRQGDNNDNYQLGYSDWIYYYSPTETNEQWLTLEM